MTTWPTSLPQDPLQRGFSQQQVDNSVRSQMGYGPDKLRRRTSAATKNVPMVIKVDQTQYAALETFYNTTIAVTGVVDWKDHITGAAAQYRFLKPPTYTPAEPGYWYASLEMEMLP